VTRVRGHVTSADGRVQLSLCNPGLLMFRLRDAAHRIVYATFVLSQFMTSAAMNDTQTSVSPGGDLDKHEG
jgi:hypothetical protein